MNNQWIEWKGGECPVSDDIFVKVKFREMLSDEGKANIFNWEHLDDEEDIIAYWHTGIPDPRKEWVKIQEGCPMPEHGQLIVIYTEGSQCMGFMTSRTVEAVAIPFLEDGPIPFSEIDSWRYPHPDPEDV